MNRQFKKKTSITSDPGFQDYLNKEAMRNVDMKNTVNNKNSNINKQNEDYSLEEVLDWLNSGSKEANHISTLLRSKSDNTDCLIAYINEILELDRE